MANLKWVNHAKIDIADSFMQSIGTISCLPPAAVVIIFNNARIPGNRYGATLPKKLSKYAQTTARLFITACGNDWDCGIAIDKEICDCINQFPAYFAYILGHELGHAHICLSDFDLHVVMCLIDMFIEKVSNGEITQWYERPHEKRFEQFGIYIAEQLFTRDKLNEEIKRLLCNSRRLDHKWLEIILSLPSSNVFGDLRALSINCVKPYKDKFLDLCTNHIEQTKGNSIAAEISNLSGFFQ